jgi:hypothetical protein
MREVMFILLLLLTTVFSHSSKECIRSWYYLENPTPDQEQHSLNSGCFHGTYGPLSLLSCPTDSSKFLSNQECSTKLCVIQTPHSEELLHKLSETENTKFLLKIGESHVISSLGQTHTCLNLDINLSDTNIITVSDDAWRPLARPHTFVFNLTAPDPFIQSVLDAVDTDRMFGYIESLSAFYSRQSSSQGAADAQHYLSTTYFEKGFDVTTYMFRDDMTDNVIAEIRGTRYPNEIICVGAHYDSRGSNSNNPSLRAPGADDNGSGSSNLLEFATVIHSQNVRFERTLRLLSFSGEEQGLLGSRAYARHLANIGENVVAMFNGDMLGWKLPNQPISLGMKDLHVDLNLLAAVNEITKTYVPTLPIGVSPSCCSDHQSFTEAGFSAVGYFENPGRASDYPYYHTSSDLPAYINKQQLGLEAKAIMAAAMTYAGAHRGN